jgi:hypothetical protein
LVCAVFAFTNLNARQQNLNGAERQVTARLHIFLKTPEKKRFFDVTCF